MSKFTDILDSLEDALSNPVPPEKAREVIEAARQQIRNKAKEVIIDLMPDPIPTPTPDYKADHQPFLDQLEELKKIVDGQALKIANLERKVQTLTRKHSRIGGPTIKPRKIG